MKSCCYNDFVRKGIAIDEFKCNFGEINAAPKSEINEEIVLNEVGDTGFKYESNASFSSIEKENKPKKVAAKKLQSRLLTMFLFACVVVATIQTSIYIPLFSDLFSVHPPSVAEIEKDYVSSVEYANFADDDLGPNRYLKYRAVFDSSFSNFEKIYYDIKNLTDDVVIEGPFVEKESLDSYGLWTILKTTPKKDYQVRVWCTTTDPTKLKYTETKMKDSLQIYLIYTAKTINY